MNDAKARDILHAAADHLGAELKANASKMREDDGWRNGVGDARKHIARHIRARAAELKGEK
jgi:hypothetical protein